MGAPSTAPWTVEDSEFGTYSVVGRPRDDMTVLVADHLSATSAHLIAAAPELYEAVEAAASYIAFRSGAAADAVRAKTCAALAKARGETA